MAQRNDQDQEREIRRLRAALAERDRMQATRAVLCNSLAEEADQLRGQLGATVRVCQELLGRLEKEKKRGALAEEPQASLVCIPEALNFQEVCRIYFAKWFGICISKKKS